MAPHTDNLPPPWRGRDDYRCRNLPTTPCPDQGLVLVTGASGYIGGRLVPELVQRGYCVRVMVRGDVKDYSDVWPNTEVVQGDALDQASLERAMVGASSAYYLIHSLILGPQDFAQTDLQAAVNFRKAADNSKLKRIIYLGGLGKQADDSNTTPSGNSPNDSPNNLASHLSSRHEVADELAKSKVPLTTLRASVIVGSGSASFEIIKNLITRLWFIPLPRWAQNSSQPIGIRDVIKYLVGVMEAPEAAGQNYDIGGLERLSYARMMEIVSEILQRRHYVVRVPLNGTRLYGFVASLMTPVPAPITQCLFGSLIHDTVCRSDAIREIVPFEPLSYREAILRALSREEQDLVATRWSDSYPPAHVLSVKLHELRHPPRYQAHYEIQTTRSPESLFAAITTIGGRNGWFKGNWMWRIRGSFDRLISGVGTARGRRSSKKLRVHDVIDFWRVEDLKTNQRLLLRSEMRMPGRAWLEFTIDPADGDNRPTSVLGITAHYATKRVGGRLYWRFFQPFHWYIFDRLLSQINQQAGTRFSVPTIQD